MHALDRGNQNPDVVAAKVRKPFLHDPKRFNLRLAVGRRLAIAKNMVKVASRFLVDVAQVRVTTSFRTLATVPGFDFAVHVNLLVRILIAELFDARSPTSMLAGFRALNKPNGINTPHAASYRSNGVHSRSTNPSIEEICMKKVSSIVGLICSGVLLLGAMAMPVQAADKARLVIQVSDNDSAKWNLALNNAKNIQKDLGNANVEMEIVAYGPGINMLKAESEVGNRIDEAVASGVKVLACQNTMRNQKLVKEDMLDSIAYVPAGVIEIMQKQHQGYAYLRP
jgi:uncharacterized protein